MAFDFIKAQKYFREELGLSNRELSKVMNNYNEKLISRYLNSNVESVAFLNKIREFFPKAPVSEWVFVNENTVNEQPEVYQSNMVERIDKVIQELTDIKRELSLK